MQAKLLVYDILVTVSKVSQYSSIQIRKTRSTGESNGASEQLVQQEKTSCAPDDLMGWFMQASEQCTVKIEEI